MKLSEKVHALLDSDITGYRIAKDTGMSISSLVKLKNGSACIDGMHLKNAEVLGTYLDQLSTKEKEKK